MVHLMHFLWLPLILFCLPHTAQSLSYNNTAVEPSPKLIISLGLELIAVFIIEQWVEIYREAYLQKIHQAEKEEEEREDLMMEDNEDTPQQQIRSASRYVEGEELDFKKKQKQSIRATKINLYIPQKEYFVYHLISCGLLFSIEANEAISYLWMMSLGFAFLHLLGVILNVWMEIRMYRRLEENRNLWVEPANISKWYRATEVVVHACDIGLLILSVLHVPSSYN